MKIELIRGKRLYLTRMQKYPYLTFLYGGGGGNGECDNKKVEGRTEPLDIFGSAVDTAIDDFSEDLDRYLCGSPKRNLQQRKEVGRNIVVWS